MPSVYVDVYSDDDPSPEELKRREIFVLERAMGIDGGVLSLATDAGMSRWPSYEERRASIEKNRDFIEQRMMSAPHPL